MEQARQLSCSRADSLVHLTPVGCKWPRIIGGERNSFRSDSQRERNEFRSPAVSPGRPKCHLLSRRMLRPERHPKANNAETRPATGWLSGIVGCGAWHHHGVAAGGMPAISLAWRNGVGDMRLAARKGMRRVKRRVLISAMQKGTKQAERRGGTKP